MPAVKSLPKSRLGGLGLPSWLPDWLTGKDVREIQGPVYIPPRGKAGGYRKELAADIARKASKDPFTQRDIYSAVQAGADFVPLVGEDVGVREAAEDWARGNYVMAGAGGLGTALGVVPVVGDVGGKLIKEGGKKLAQGLGGPKIKAYHGSPHSFEEFDISKVGTGEGAQAYGHGLYFAENEDVARGYRKSLAGPAKFTPRKQDSLASKTLARFLSKRQANVSAVSADDNFHSAVVEAKRWLSHPMKYDDALAELDTLTPDDFTVERPGHMYEVDIAADPEHFLDWDKPVSEQPEAMQKALVEAGGFGNTRALSEKLKEAGIPGIRYLDAGSRMSDEAAAIVKNYGSREKAMEIAQMRLKNASLGDIGYWQKIVDDLKMPESRNYVVFDPKIISIVKKYGIPAAIASGLISEEMGRRMQEQGEI